MAHPPPGVRLVRREEEPLPCETTTKSTPAPHRPAPHRSARSRSGRPKAAGQGPQRKCSRSLQRSVTGPSEPPVSPDLTRNQVLLGLPIGGHAAVTSAVPGGRVPGLRVMMLRKKTWKHPASPGYCSMRSRNVLSATVRHDPLQTGDGGGRGRAGDEP